MANDEVESRGADSVHGVDHHLAELVGIVNRSNGEFAITLTVGGMLISGLLTGGKRYHEEFAEQFLKGMGDLEPETSEPIKEFFKGFGAIYARQEGDEMPEPLTTFIHLREARFFVPGAAPVPANGGVLWRGRLVKVDGYHLGILTMAGAST